MRRSPVYFESTGGMRFSKQPFLGVEYTFEGTRLGSRYILTHYFLSASHVF